MKIHFYQVEVENSPDDLPAVLDRIRGYSLEDREQAINNKPVFLEVCDRTENGSYELDFTQRRIQNGPGYSQRGAQTTDFPLADGAGFGEQTAAIWSPSGHLAVQYNHHGVRPGTIRDYLCLFLRADTDDSIPVLSLLPVVAADVYVRLRDSAVQTRIECAIDTSRLTEESAANHVALQSMLRLRDETHAGKATLTLSVGADRRGGPLSNVLRLVDRLRQDDSVERLQVKVKQDVDGQTETLDLLEQRETREVPDTDLVLTRGRRYEYRSRIAAVRSVFEQWLRQQ